MGEPLRFEVADGVARMVLDRPDSLNALTTGMARAWRAAALEAVARDDVRAVMIRASGRAFCAGGDVHAMAQMESGRELTELARDMNAGIVALAESGTPVLTVVQGVAAGGGLGVALTGDYILAGESARFGALYAPIGATPDLSVTARLAEAVGERRAMQLLLTDRLLPSTEAREWGLVAEVVPDGELAERANQIAARWAGSPPGALGDAKRLLLSRRERGLAGQLEAEAVTIGAAIDRPVARDLISAFASRRTP